MPICASAMPRAPLAPASNKLSVSSCLAIRARPAPKCGADGDFLPTGLGLGQKQVRDRRARNEKDNRDGPEHDEQRTSGVTGHEIVQRNRIAVHPSVPLVGDKSRADPAVADRGEFIRDLMRIRTVPQSADAED